MTQETLGLGKFIEVRQYYGNPVKSLLIKMKVENKVSVRQRSLGTFSNTGRERLYHFITLSLLLRAHFYVCNAQEFGLNLIIYDSMQTNLFFFMLFDQVKQDNAHHVNNLIKTNDSRKTA